MLVDPDDAAALFAALGISNAGGGGSTRAHGLFESDWFGRWPGAPMPVEVMSGLRVRSELVVPRTRQAIALGPTELFVPAVDELREILLRFGRPKDVARAAALTTAASKRTRTC